MEKYLPAQLDKIKFHGRRSEQKPFCMFWHNSGIEMNIKARELYVTINCNYSFYEPWIEYEINDAMISRVRLEKGENRICIFRGFDASNVKNIKILRDSQPFSWNEELVEITSIETDGELCDVPDKKYKFEFYGDSITSGEGLCGALNEYDFVPMYISSRQSYPRQLAKMFDADIRVVSQCGWGVVGGWDNNPNSAVPSCFDTVCGVVRSSEINSAAASEKYDFDSFKSDAVIINLGTNDNTAFSGAAFKDDKGNENKITNGNPDDERKFKDAVKDFVGNVREKNSNAVIVWAVGIMAIEYTAGLIQDALEEYKAAAHDDKVYYLPLEPMGQDDFGSRGHPGLPAHKKMTEQIGAFLKENL